MIKAQVNKFFTYMGDVKKEFKHIKFLSRREVYQISLVILISVAIFSVAFSLLDFGVNLLIRFIIGL